MALFRDAKVDPSIQHRTNGYGLAGRYFQERPLLGRGLNTFLPNNYVLLDNELIFTALTAGLIGLAAFVLLFAGGYFVGRSVRHHAADDAAKHLGQALAASLIAALVASATFDAFFYPTFVGVVFMCLGATGALFRLTRGGEMQSSLIPGPSPVVQSAPTVVAPPLRMKWEQYLDKRYGARTESGPPKTQLTGGVEE
jgi:O-antigen ligase